MATRRAFETALTDPEEQSFQKWKSIYAPNDSGADYDLRGAFKAGLTPDKQTGHWPDTFKKPNHPTFSPESIYHPNNVASPLGVFNAVQKNAAAPPPKTLDAAAQRRILGLTPSRPQTAAQAADQAAHERSLGLSDGPNANQILAQRAARLAKDPYDLDYAENHSGEFGSGTHPLIASDKTSRARGDGTIVQPEIRRATLAATPAITAPGTTPLGNRMALLSGVPKDANFSAEPPAVPQFGGLRLNTDLTSSDPALARPPEPPGRAEMAGRTVRRVVGNVLGAIPKESVFGSSNYAAPPATSDTPIFDLPKAIAGFTRGMFGRQTEAGVSRSQVARIQQPTKENPVPVTDTTPAANIDDSKNAIQKFATDVTPDWTRRKFAFAGF
jgi:hypothetical protein